ncbi:MAG: glycoside hydrolase family 108 protein [Rhodobacteraceae bacterium]|jgi:lysozyme family protein|nr:glycoside hydrolase family 108 protein [Paracoccaceae bacterium]
MDRAAICIPRILKHEGGYVNHPSDPGGPTNKGITLATFRRYISRNGTVADLKALTTDQAVRVYKAQYWDAVRADELPAGLDYAVADYAVNSGPGRAVKALQRVLGVAVDGKIGPVTLSAARAVSVAGAINALCDERMAFLRRLKTWPTFGKGWTRRVADVRADALRDAVAPQRPAEPPLVLQPSTPAPTSPPAGKKQGSGAAAGGIAALVLAGGAALAAKWAEFTGWIASWWPF